MKALTSATTPTLTARLRLVNTVCFFQTVAPRLSDTPLTTITATKLRSPMRVRPSTLRPSPMRHQLRHTSSLSLNMRSQNPSTSLPQPTSQLPLTSLPQPQPQPIRGLSHPTVHQLLPTVKANICHFLTL